MLNRYCNEKIALIDRSLDELLSGNDCFPKIFEAMRYSLLAGGKRLRPIMLMAAADAVGSFGERFINVACGLEMIHTYSLIHDDLPAMDNDDYRRGKLTNHKVFGDGMAILAGDGLLTAAFDIMLAQPEVNSSLLLKVIREIAGGAGPNGMVGGQALDMLSEGKELDLETLRCMHKAKTGALFKAAIRAGALLGEATNEQLNALTAYAEYYGLAFQITDDILDVIGNQETMGKPVGSDQKNYKATYVTIYGLETAKVMAQDAVDNALCSLSIFNNEADVLRELVKLLIVRNS